MTTRRRSTIGALLTAVAAAGVLLVAGCAPDGHVQRRDAHAVSAVVPGGTETEPGPSAAAPTGADPSPGDSVPAASPTASGLPDGFHSVDVPSLGVRVGVRDDMEVLDAAVMTTGQAGQILDEMAARLGLSHDQMVTMSQQCQLLAVAPDGTSLNLVDAGSAKLPTEAQVRAGFQQMGMTDMELAHRDTAFGSAITLRGALSVAAGGGQRVVYEQNLWTTSSTGVFSLDVASLDEAALDPLFEVVAGSLQPLR